MKKNVKITLIIVVTVLLVGYGIYGALQPMAVETKTLSYETSEITFTESGIVVNTGEKAVYPLTPGEVKSILVKEGDVVVAGQVLAEIDSALLDSQIDQAVMTLEGYKAQLAGAEKEHEVTTQTLRGNRSNLVAKGQTLRVQSGTAETRALEKLLEEQSKAIYEKGVADLEKNKTLLALGMISESAYADFEQLVKTYEANYLKNKVAASGGGNVYSESRAAINAQIAAIDTALAADTLTTTKRYYEAMIAGAKAAIKGLESQRATHRITAPVAGVINGVTIENTNRLSGLEPAFYLQGEGAVHIEAKVSTRDIDTIALGDEVRLTLDRRSGDLEIAGKITHIASSAIVDISPLGIEERKVMVYIEPESLEGLGAGYEVDVAFILLKESGQLVVPNSALYQVDGADTVMVIRSGKAVEVPVEKGYELTGETIINGGLSEGDQLITDLDADGLSPGKSVTSSNE